MLTHWTNLIKTDCRVVRIGKDYIYPIFKCGCTTLFVNADQILVNEELQNLSTIKIILRDPEERFIAGVNKYCDDNNVAIDDVVKQIKKERVADEHFVPQWVWLFHLYRFYIPCYFWAIILIKVGSLSLFLENPLSSIL